MRLICVGDLALGDHPKTVGHGIHSRYRTGLPSSRAGRLFPKDVGADVIFGNLEYDLSQDALAGDGLYDLQCRGIKAYADFLKAAGFNVVNMANNHIFQHGRRAYEDTVAVLRDRGITVCGNEEDLDGKTTVANVGFVGWSQRPRQHFTGRPLYNELDEKTFEDQIRRLRDRFDVLVASVHWGDEFIQIPSDDEVRIARAMIDAGATAVIGHHPHVLRRIEKYKDGLIAYSLGNFICDMSWEDRTSSTGALSFEASGGKVTSWTFHPARIGADFFPEYLGPADAKRFLSDLERVFESQERDKARDGYAAVAARELKRHKAASGRYFVRNLHRYGTSVILQILFGAVRGRLGLEPPIREVAER